MPRVGRIAGIVEYCRTPGRRQVIHQFPTDNGKYPAANHGAILLNAQTVECITAHTLVTAGAKQQWTGYQFAAGAYHLADLCANDYLPALDRRR